MISDKIVIADRGNQCDGLEAGLEMVEKMARFSRYTDRQGQELRLLAEEMIAGSAAILDVFKGTLWVETKEGKFAIKLEMKGLFKQEEREDLIHLTRNNKNTLPKGFFARLGVLLGDALTGEYYFPYGVGADPSGMDVMWTNAELTEMLREMETKKDPEDASMADVSKIILNEYADDIQVAARSNQVVITVTKALPQ